MTSRPIDLVDQSLHLRGLHPKGALLDEVRDLLAEQAGKERRGQGLGDTELMRLCCVQLFNAANLHDVLLIWRAKRSSMDADCSIDIELLCGAGLPAAKAFLAERQSDSQEAQAALRCLLSCEASGDFEGFTVDERAAQYAAFYCDG